jgi:hypothetical protein
MLRRGGGVVIKDHRDQDALVLVVYVVGLEGVAQLRVSPLTEPSDTALQAITLGELLVGPEHQTIASVGLSEHVCSPSVSETYARVKDLCPSLQQLSDGQEVATKLRISLQKVVDLVCAMHDGGMVAAPQQAAHVWGG